MESHGYHLNTHCVQYSEVATVNAGVTYDNCCKGLCFLYFYVVIMHLQREDCVQLTHKCL
jgi:hypothetical protein